jgi:hypothetical protein
MPLGYAVSHQIGSVRFAQFGSTVGSTGRDVARYEDIRARARSRSRASRLLASCPVGDKTRCLSDSNRTGVERQMCRWNVTKSSRGDFVVVARVAVPRPVVGGARR